MFSFAPSYSSIEIGFSSDHRYAVALFTADRCPKACAESANQEREERPVHRVRRRFAGGIGSLLSLAIDVIDSFLSIGLTQSGSRLHQLGKIRPVSRHHASVSQVMREDKLDLAPRCNNVARTWCRASAALPQQGIYKISVLRSAWCAWPGRFRGHLACPHGSAHQRRRRRCQKGRSNNQAHSPNQQSVCGVPEIDFMRVYPHPPDAQAPRQVATH